MSKPITTDLYQDPESPFYIDPDWLVMLVGPGSIEGASVVAQDLNLYFLAEYLKNTLVLVDREGPSSTGGYGDIRLIERGLADLNQRGARHCVTEIATANLGESGAYQKIMKESVAMQYGKLDLIVDHASWSFIGMDETEKSLANLASLYADLLGNHGKLFQFFNPEKQDADRRAERDRQFERKGLKMRIESDIDDRYEINDIVANDLLHYRYSPTGTSYSPHSSDIPCTKVGLITLQAR